MENASQKKSRKWRERIAFALGNLGHSAFYGALSTYFIVFVTSGMFDGVEKTIFSSNSTAQPILAKISLNFTDRRPIFIDMSLNGSAFDKCSA